MTNRLLFVDDEKDILELMETIFENQRFETRSAQSGREALATVVEFKPQLVLLDYMMPDMDGLEVLKTIKNLDPDIEVIMVTGRGSERIAVELIKAGAIEYIIKPFDYTTLRKKVDETLLLREKKLKERAEEEARLQKENLLYREMQKEFQFDFVGVSSVMKELIEKTKVIAQRNVTVLVRGESGTGKELVARMIHLQSERRDKPFLTMNCAAITETLIESELFGHEKGSFTGADSRRLGKFELANGGTLFLDEIGDMSLTTQAKVLRVIQDKQFERVGGEHSISTDIRLITATHRNLEEMCKEGSFREDLFYRINVHPIRIPRLADRVEDIPVLFDYFVRHYSREFSKYIEEIDLKLYTLITMYPWPGNVRELRNVVERMVMLAKSHRLTAEDLPEEILPSAKKTVADNHTILSLKEAVDKCKKETLEKALVLCNGNRTRAAKLLGVSLRHVQNMIHKYQLD